MLCHDGPAQPTMHERAMEGVVRVMIKGWGKRLGGGGGGGIRLQFKKFQVQIPGHFYIDFDNLIMTSGHLLPFAVKWYQDNPAFWEEFTEQPISCEPHTQDQ